MRTEDTCKWRTGPEPARKSTEQHFHQLAGSSACEASTLCKFPWLSPEAATWENESVDLALKTCAVAPERSLCSVHRRPLSFRHLEQSRAVTSSPPRGGGSKDPWLPCLEPLPALHGNAAGQGLAGPQPQGATPGTGPAPLPFGRSNSGRPLSLGCAKRVLLRQGAGARSRDPAPVPTSSGPAGPWKLAVPSLGGDPASPASRLPGRSPAGRAPC